jgi:hypothetical protein
MRLAILGNEQSGHLTLHACDHEHRSWLGQRLHARRHVGRLAEDFSGRIDHDRPLSTPMRAPSSGRSEWAFLRISSASACWMPSAARTARPESPAIGCPNNAMRPSPSFFGNAAAYLRRSLRRSVEVGADQIAPILGIEPRREAHRVDEIAEHHGDRTTFRVPACAKRHRSRGQVGFGWRSAFFDKELGYFGEACNRLCPRADVKIALDRRRCRCEGRCRPCARPCRSGSRAARFHACPPATQSSRP